MRRLILLGLIALVVLPAGASRHVTVAQLEQILTNAASHHSDDDVVRLFGDLELTERYTNDQRRRLAEKLHLGPRTTVALQLLADESAFLELPRADLPNTPAPDAATEQHILNGARRYVIDTLPRMPNLLATRSTFRFDNSPQTVKVNEWPVRAGLHLMGSSSREFTLRDDVLIQNAEMKSAAGSGGQAYSRPETGLRTAGEFGPFLVMIMHDTFKGKIAFHHWEPSFYGPLAVFRYSVPKDASNYTVDYCCLADQLGVRLQQGGRRGGSVPPPSDLQDDPSKHFHKMPAYHGSLFIDPATGAILRITMQAELDIDGPVTRADVLVEYGPVMIGDRKFICPLLSLALTQGPAGTNATLGLPPERQITEASFTQYHRLGSSVRVIANEAEADAPNPTPPSPNTQSSPSPGTMAGTAPSPNPATEPTGTELALNSPPPMPAASQPAASVSPTAAPPNPPPAPDPPPDPVVPEISLTPATGVPDLPASVTQPHDSTTQSKAKPRLVEVGIVAYDKKGNPVRDLKAEDFEVYDNGQKQDVRYFSQFSSGISADTPSGETHDRTFTNSAANPASGSPRTATDPGATILLIDEVHTAAADMTRARQEMLRFLASTPPGERVGIYTMNGMGFQILHEVTRDHAALMAKLQGWAPPAHSETPVEREGSHNHPPSTESHESHEAHSAPGPNPSGNPLDLPDAATPVDVQLRSLGSNPTRASLIIFRGVARHLSTIPGYKNLVWISSDSVFSDWQNQAAGANKGPGSVDAYALHSQEAMNEAHVAVFPMDVSQSPVQTATSKNQGFGDDSPQDSLGNPMAAGLNRSGTSRGGGSGGPPGSGPSIDTGRNSIEMQQFTRPIQAPVQQVADATGGRIVRHPTNLPAELASIVQQAHGACLLGFSPQGPPDGQYHTIQVKLVEKQRGLTLRFRSGYLFAKDPDSLKDRFEQAVWRPRDVGDITVTAGVTPISSAASAQTYQDPGVGAKVKVGIFLSDLGLQQRDDRWLDRVDIYFVQRDDAGIEKQVDGQTLGLRLTASTYQSMLTEGVPFEHVVQLQPGMASLRVLVVDENSGRMGSVTIPAPALGATP
jgi:VWFA-related protein